MEAPKRPSPAWVTVVKTEIEGETVESTLEGLRRAMMTTMNNTLRPNDFEWEDKTGLNVFKHEAWWKNAIDSSAFPYITISYCR